MRPNNGRCAQFAANESGFSPRLGDETDLSNSAVSQPGQDRIQSLNILVIDDTDLTREVVVHMLRAAGHTVLAASSPQQGLAIFECFRLDLVITDFSMPQMNGGELATAIKAHSPTQPILMISGLAGSLQRSFLRQVDYLLAKPFTPDELYHAIAAVVSREALSGQSDDAGDSLD